MVGIAITIVIFPMLISGAVFIYFEFSDLRSTQNLLLHGSYSIQNLGLENDFCVCTCHYLKKWLQITYMNWVEYVSFLQGKFLLAYSKLWIFFAYFFSSMKLMMREFFFFSKSLACWVAPINNHCDAQRVFLVLSLSLNSSIGSLNITIWTSTSC